MAIVFEDSAGNRKRGEWVRLTSGLVLDEDFRGIPRIGPSSQVTGGCHVFRVWSGASGDFSASTWPSSAAVTDPRWIFPILPGYANQISFRIGRYISSTAAGPGCKLALQVFVDGQWVFPGDNQGPQISVDSTGYELSESSMSTMNFPANEVVMGRIVSLGTDTSEVVSLGAVDVVICLHTSERNACTVSTSVLTTLIQECFTELVADGFSGGDDADIHGRVPDGAGTGELSTGVWTRNDSLADNPLNLTSGKIVQTGGDDFWDSIYTTQSVAGMEADQYGQVTGRFTTLVGGDAWFGVALRFSANENVGYYVFVDTDKRVRIYYSNDWSGYNQVTNVLFSSLQANTDYELTAVASGSMIKVYMDGVQVLCVPHSAVPAAGAPGLDVGDTSGDGSIVQISSFSAGIGNPMLDAGECSSETRCDEVTIGSSLRNMIGTGVRLAGPNGSNLAATLIDPALPAYVEVTATHEDAEFIFTRVAESTLMAYVPGTGGVNKFSLGFSGLSPGAVTSWPLSGNGSGITYRAAKNYVDQAESLLLSEISGAASSATKSNDRLYFDDPASNPTLTYGVWTIWGVMNGSNFEVWIQSSCGDDLGSGPGNPHRFLNLAPSASGFPGKTYPDTSGNSHYICNYFEIVKKTGVPQTSLNYGFICSRPIGSSHKVDTNHSAFSFTSACGVADNDGPPDDVDFVTVLGATTLPNWSTEPAHIYVGSRDSGTIWALDATTGAVDSDYTFDSGLSTGVRGMTTINDDLVVVGANGVVKRFSYGTNAQLWSANAGTDGYYCEHVVNGFTVWVSCPTDGTVVRVQTSDGAILSTTSVGSTPKQIAYNSDAGMAYVANNGDGTVTRMDRLTGAVIDTIDVGAGPWGIAYNNNGAMWTGFDTAKPLKAV